MPEVKDPIIKASLKATYTTSHFVKEAWRVRWMLFAACAIIVARTYGVEWGLVSESSPVLKTLYRPAIGALGFVFAHVAYQQAFPWLNMRDLLFRAIAIDDFVDLRPDVPARAVAAAMFVGACFLRGSIYAAFVAGSIMAV